MKKEEQPDFKRSLFDFAENYVKTNDEFHKERKEMLKMIDKGYELQLVHLRKGSQLMWCKKK